MDLSSRSQKKVDSIVVNASRLFVQHGYHKVTMESVAQYANVSKVTLYKYFRDKQVLYEHIIKLNYVTEYNEIVDIISSHVPYDEKVDEVVKACIRKYYDHSKPVFDNEITLSYEVQKEINEYTIRIAQERIKLYNQGRIEGFIDEEVTDDTLDLFFDVVQNGLLTIIQDMTDFNKPEVTELLKLLYTGIMR
jgi:AcrR family transcriptional regulator